MTIVPALTQRNAFQSRGGWGQCCGRMTRQVVGNALLSNPVCDGFRDQSTLIYLFFPSDRWRPLDLSQAVRCYDTDMTIDL